MSCFDDEAKRLRQEGYRLTPQRLLVMETLYHEAGFATADDIWARIQERFPGVDVSTVYRILQFLKEQNLVVEIHPPSGSAQYAAIHKETPHAHAVCTSCGKVLNVDLSWLDQISDRLMAEHGFAINQVGLEVPGLCAACQE